MNHSFVFPRQCVVKVPRRADRELIDLLLHSHVFGVDFTVEESDDDCAISIGSVSEASIGSAEAVLYITEHGISIRGKDFFTVMRGFVTMLTKIEISKSEKIYYIPCEMLHETPAIGMRSVHLCVFPETSFSFLQKCIRACGMEKYSHVILEFWGMLRYDCMKELGWSMAFEKAQIRKLVQEANTFGMEVIPMFNHLGHASGCRAMNGKHVVLDQNPAYEYLYDFDGWVWDYELEEVKTLHRQIREELMELCGEGHYFHLGCDEAYTLGNRTEKGEGLCLYLNEIEAELEASGRRGIIWGDMLLLPETYESEPWHYYCTGEPNVQKVLCEKLSRGLIIADWQYDTDANVWPTSRAFEQLGFDVICCPWDRRDNIVSAIETVNTLGLYGLMHTTWHTLFKGFPQMLYAGAAAWTGDTTLYPAEAARFHAAKVVRKTSPAKGDYAYAGWSEKMMGPGLV